MYMYKKNRHERATNQRYRTVRHHLDASKTIDTYFSIYDSGERVRIKTSL